jgi:hypothetical protein
MHLLHSLDSIPGSFGAIMPKDFDSAREILCRLQALESMLAMLVQHRTVKEWYSVADVAEQLGKAEFTVREWARQGRIRARKKPSGRGLASEWMISHEELERIRNEGLLPVEKPYRHGG